MAGPGGGPPRKSHTKSRKGCRMCKKRHIRCDEFFPQCRNCTKHSVRCDYMDVTNAGDESTKGSNPPDLLTSPQLQQVLDNWRLTGVSPLPELQKADTSYWTRFSTIDLRLVHHITTLSSEMYRRGYASCTPWTPQMSNLITVALSNDFVMNAVLALSASHLAWQTDNSDTEHLAYHHRGIALKGLHDALGTFSEQNSEAVLAASMLLSWQARDWQTWVSLQKGISTVMNAMRPWMHQSELARFLDSQRCLARMRTPTTPSISGLPPQQPAEEEINRLDQIMTALHSLRLRFASFPDLVEHVESMLEYVEQIQQDYPLQGPNRTFDRLLYLRSVIFWLPTMVLRPEDMAVGVLAMMSHFLALALVLEPLFTDIGGAYLGNLSLEPLERMCQLVQQRSAAAPHDTTLRTALSMLEVPMQIAHAYRSSHRAITSPRLPYQLSSPQTAHYGPRSMPIPSPPGAVRQGSYSGTTLRDATSIPQGNAYMHTYQNTMPNRNNSFASSGPSQPRLSTSSSLHSIALPQNDDTDGPPTTIDYFGGTTAYQQTPYVNINDYQNRAIELPRPPILNSIGYDTIPPSTSTKCPRTTHGQDYQQQIRRNSQGWD